MRYKELQAKGEDTDNHDFKSEWIPHWSRRSTEIYEDEVKQKTQELLMKFGLLDTLEPKRADYPGMVTSTLFFLFPISSLLSYGARRLCKVDGTLNLYIIRQKEYP